MKVSKPIAVDKDELFNKADKLNAERVARIAQTPPKLSGSGYMPNKINEMVSNMKELHTKSLELISQSAEMLNKYGYTFAEIDEMLSNSCKKH